jgi:hypothetical protein
MQRGTAAVEQVFREEPARRSWTRLRPLPRSGLTHLRSAGVGGFAAAVAYFAPRASK